MLCCRKLVMRLLLGVVMMMVMVMVMVIDMRHNTAIVADQIAMVRLLLALMLVIVHNGAAVRL